MGSISHHIMPLVINSLGGGYTHTNTHINMHTDVHTGTILRNQVSTGLWLTHAWFNKLPQAGYHYVAPQNFNDFSEQDCAKFCSVGN